MRSTAGGASLVRPLFSPHCVRVDALEEGRAVRTRNGVVMLDETYDSTGLSYQAIMRHWRRVPVDDRPRSVRDAAERARRAEASTTAEQTISDAAECVDDDDEESDSAAYREEERLLQELWNSLIVEDDNEDEEEDDDDETDSEEAAEEQLLRDEQHDRQRAAAERRRRRDRESRAAIELADDDELQAAAMRAAGVVDRLLDNNDDGDAAAAQRRRRVDTPADDSDDDAGRSRPPPTLPASDANLPSALLDQYDVAPQFDEHRALDDDVSCRRRAHLARGTLLSPHCHKHIFPPLFTANSTSSFDPRSQQTVS